MNQSLTPVLMGLDLSEDVILHYEKWHKKAEEQNGLFLKTEHEPGQPGHNLVKPGHVTEMRGWVGEAVRERRLPVI